MAFPVRRGYDSLPPLREAAMARAYSHDLRVRVLEAVDAGLSRRAAAARYRIGIATLIRWAALVAVTGETVGRPRRQVRLGSGRVGGSAGCY